MEPKIKGLGSILDFCVGIIIMRSDFEEGGRGGGKVEETLERRLVR